MAFGERINDTVEWIQTKIKKHDQAAWEQHAEKKLKDFPVAFQASKRVKQKKELIDVDLVRGSNFEKPKPVCNWTNVTFFGLLKLILLPFYCKWWIGKTSRMIYCVAVLMWLMQLLMALLVLKVEVVDDVLLCELLTPIVLWLVVGLTFCQAVATDMKKAKKSGISTLIKKSKISSAAAVTKLPPTTTKPHQKTSLKPKTHTKTFNKKLENCPNLRRRVVLRNSAETLKTSRVLKSPTTASTLSTSTLSTASSHDIFPILSDDPTLLEHSVTYAGTNLNIVLTSATSDDESESSSPDKRLHNDNHVFAQSQKIQKAKDSDSESELDRSGIRSRRESGSSSESERETDSSEHNGMTESMWTESETDSRAPACRARSKPTFSTINEMKERDVKETSSENESDKENEDIAEPQRASTPRLPIHLP